MGNCLPKERKIRVDDEEILLNAIIAYKVENGLDISQDEFLSIEHVEILKILGFVE